jgi:hypothetical protein
MKIPVTTTFIVHLPSFSHATTNRIKIICVALTKEVKATTTCFTVMGIFHENLASLNTALKYFTKSNLHSKSLIQKYQ